MKGTYLQIMITGLIVIMLLGCANKDWYIHLRAKIQVPVDFTVGRGSSHTVQTVTTNDDAQ